MIVKGRINGESIDVEANVPEMNALISSAILVPIIREKSATKFHGSYKMPENINNASFEGFYKRIIYEKATAKLDIAHYNLMDDIEYIDKLHNEAVYYDGSYVNDVVDFKKYSFVYSVAFTKEHKKWIEKNAKKDGVEIDKIFFVNYKRYVDTRDRYVYGTKWLASVIGGSIANIVLIPNTPDFWSTERYRHLYSEGSKWVSRYYGRIVTISNPVEDNKKTIMRGFSENKDVSNYIVCRCGECMECLTNYIVASDILPEDFFEEDPRKFEEGMRKIRTAHSLNLIGAELYIDTE